MKGNIFFPITRKLCKDAAQITRKLKYRHQQLPAGGVVIRSTFSEN